MIALLLVTLFQGAAPTQATAPVASFSAPTPAKAAPMKPDKNGLVCRKEATLGSRLKTKICMRPEDAQQRAIDDRDLLEKAQVLQTIRDPAAGPTP